MTQMITLPVSGRQIGLRPLTGTEELLLLEASEDDLALALSLLTRLACPLGEDVPDGPCAWLQLTPTDLDYFVLRLRQSMLGDRIVSDVRCGAPACNERIDVSFGIDDYLAHHLNTRQRLRGRGWRAENADEPGWFRVESLPRSKSYPGDAVVFRLPTAGDLTELAMRGDAAAELTRRCIRSEPESSRPRRMAEAAMAVIAPNLSQDLRGQCPKCAARMDIRFDPRHYCLRELRDRAKFIYQEVDAIARRYHWSESDILALPLPRRMRYADVARLDGASA